MYDQIIGYTLRYFVEPDNRGVIPQPISEKIITSTFFTLEGLEPNSYYVVEVLAQAKSGLSPPIRAWNTTFPASKIIF